MADASRHTDDCVNRIAFKPYILWISDGQGQLLDIEDRWFELTGLSKPESLGNGWLTTCHPDDRPRLERAILRSATLGHHFDVQHRVLFADGHYRWVHSHARASRNRLGEIRRWHGATEQIERRVRAQARRHKLEIELEHATRAAALVQISGSLAHELSQPLAAAGSFLEGCEATMRECSRHGDDRLLYGLTKAREQIDHASAIVSRLRRFIQRREPRAEPISVNEAVSDALALATADEVEQLELGTDVRLDPANAMVMADRVELQQLIFNLVRNAIEAMQHTARKELRISTVVKRDRVEIHVIDSGPGLSIDREDLFEPFITTKPNGLGLGLAICRTIVKRRGGEISACNGPSGGTMFLVNFPRIMSGGSRTRH
jgi:two-component system sensor kinase FixL